MLQAMLHQLWAAPRPSGRQRAPGCVYYFFPSPIKPGKPVCNSTHAGVIKRALLHTGTPTNVVLHLARRLKTRVLQSSHDVTLAEIAAAMRWKSIFGAAATYFDICLPSVSRLMVPCFACVKSWISSLATEG